MGSHGVHAVGAAFFLLVALLGGTGGSAVAIPPSLDGDGDGWINTIETLLGSDAGDPFKTPESFGIPASCLDGADNDGDGATDDADPGCHPQPVISGSFPPAGFDVFESELRLDDFDLNTPQGICPIDFEGLGPTVIRRGNPEQASDGHLQIDVEIVAMQLTGTAQLLPGSPCNPEPGMMVVPAVFIEDPAAASAGKVIGSAPGADFPADSFFDVNFLVDTPLGLIPGGPLRVENGQINTLPPLHTPNNPDGNPDCYNAAGVEHCPKPPLDHFQCYTGEFPPFPPQDVQLLADQFVGTSATVREPQLFCNPVEKDRLPIFDEGAHLLFYAIDSPDAGVVNGEVVVVRNQFGTQTLELGDLLELAVPTQKDQHAPPFALDHYDCYGVTGNALNRPVSLSDQFHQSNTVVTAPTRLCAPAFKVHDGRLTTVGDERWHLTCYTTQPVAFSPVAASTSNQFGDADIVATAPSGLCVPSQKFSLLDPPVIPPVAIDDGPFIVARSGTLTVPDGAGDLLSNDIDIDGDPLTAARATSPVNGTVTVNADGSFTYVHDGSRTSSDTFTYTANDGTADSDPAVVTITVIPGCAGLIPTIVGTPAGELLEGTRDDDVIVGSGGNDIIRGKGGNDTICGGAGDDLIAGGPGNDTIIGQAGNDTVDYSAAPAGVVVNLGRRIATGGHGTDSIRQVRNIIGSRFNDVLFGNALDNEIRAGRGDDVVQGKRGNDSLFGERGDDSLNGRGGDDLLHGGPGTDQATYIQSSAGVTVSLGIAGPQATGDGLDELVRIENLFGSRHDDVLSGNGLANTIRGSHGDDRLFGRTGDDLLIGNRGNDLGNGGSGTDTCRTETKISCE